MEPYIFLGIWLAGIVICWLIVYVAYNLDTENQDSNAYILLMFLSVCWPVGVVMAIPAVLFFLIGDFIVAVIRRYKRRGI
jgi:uncharacterized membrane protein